MEKIAIKLIDRKVATTQKNKMADSSRESSNVLIQSLMNLRAKTSNKAQTTGCESGSQGPPNNGCDGSIEVYESEVLNKILEFYATVRKTLCPGYCCYRCLTEKEYKSSIICDIKFKSSKHIPDEKARLIR